MPEWLWGFIIGGSGGGILGYLLHSWIDERFAQRKEFRQFRQADLRAMRDELLVFLGQPRAHYDWLETVTDVRTAGGTPSPDQKAQLIAEWVYKNAPRFPKDRRGLMYLILNVSYRLARGDRSFLDKIPNGYEALHEAWTDLDEYAQLLTRQLHGDAKS